MAGIDSVRATLERGYDHVTALANARACAPNRRDRVGLQQFDTGDADTRADRDTGANAGATPRPGSDSHSDPAASRATTGADLHAERARSGDAADGHNAGRGRHRRGR